MTRRIAFTAFVLLLAGILIAGGVAEVVRQSASLTSLVIGGLATLAAVVLVVRADPTLLFRVLDEFRAVLPVAAYALTAPFIDPAHGNGAFDEVGAQVIVVLLLALALEARFFRLHRVREPLDLLGTLFVLTVLGIGEFYSLQAIAAERPAHSDVIGGAIAAGFVAVAITALTGGEDSSRDAQ